MERRKSVYNVICPVCNCSNVKIALTANIFVLPMEYLSGVMRNDNHFRSLEIRDSCKQKCCIVPSLNSSKFANDARMRERKSWKIQHLGHTNKSIRK